MTKVMVFGAFDGFHPGHLNFFKQAREHGDYLIVSVGRNKNVEKIKGTQPLFDEKERLELISACRLVDEAVLGAPDKFYDHIAKFSPDVICLGYDQWANEAEVKAELRKVGLKNTKVVRLFAHEPSRAKSTILKVKSVDF